MATQSLTSAIGAAALNYSPYRSYDLSSAQFSGYNSYNTMGNYGSVWNGYNTNSIAQNEELAIKQMESNFRIQEKSKELQARTGSPERTLKDTVGSLQDSILANKQDTLMAKYHEALAMVKEMHPEMSEKDAKAYLKEFYNQSTGSNLVQDIRNHGSSDFTNNVKKALFFGLGNTCANKSSAEDNIREINGDEETSAEKATKVAGGITGGALSGAAVGAAIGLIGGPVGAGIGALIGGGVGLIAGWLSGAASKKASK